MRSLLNSTKNFTIEQGDLKVPRILKWFCKNKILVDVISKSLKEKDTISISRLFS